MSKESFLRNMLRHVETSAISDFLIELAQQDSGQQEIVAKVSPFVALLLYVIFYL